MLLFNLKLPGSNRVLRRSSKVTLWPVRTAYTDSLAQCLLNAYAFACTEALNNGTCEGKLFLSVEIVVASVVVQVSTFVVILRCQDDLASSQAGTC